MSKRSRGENKENHRDFNLPAEGSGTHGFESSGFLAPLMNMQREINRIMKESAHIAVDLWPGQAERVMPKIKVLEDENAFYLRTKLPGNNFDNIEVVVNDNFMTLKWHEEHRQESVSGYSYRSRKCHRTVMLPPNADAGKAEAMLKNGSLEVSVQKIQNEEKGQRIPIRKS